jgi:hypothetical protein
MAAFTEWTMQGTEIAHCNCECGCPCQFSRLPTHGRCEAYGFVQIDTGKFGDVPLDGLRWGIVATWPGPIHLGHGTMQIVVDDRADAKQRAAIDAVAHGKDTEPGKIVWAVFASMTETFLPTLSKAIDLNIDVENRIASVKVAGVVDGAIEPIRNPVTGQPSRARLTLPNGFEFTDAEFASGTGKAIGEIKLDFANTHAHLARVHWTTHGVVRPA